MLCQNCQNEITNDAKFCKFCGKKVIANNYQADGSVDLYFKKRDNSCQVCGAYAPVKYAKFHQNIGMLLMRNSQEIEGQMCKKCINKIFWKYTLITLAIGWLGAISLIVAPLFIISNIYYYISSLNLPHSNNT